MTFSSLYSSNTVLDGTAINGTNFSVTFNKRNGGTATQYYTNGSSVRWYGGGTMRIESAKTITEIKITFTQTANTVSTDVGSYSGGTWTGSASSVLFTQSGTSGHCRISSITVTYEDGGTPSGPVDPSVSFAADPFTVKVGRTGTNTITKPSDLTVTYSSDDESIATVDENTGEVTGVAEGQTTITATWDAVTDTYNAGSESYTLNVEAIPAAVDGLFDFTQKDIDYGTGLAPSSSQAYITDDNTWIAGNVTLVTSGKYRWWESTSSYDLRFFSDANSKFTLSVPEGKVIKTIAITGSGNGVFTASTGTYSSGTWTGSANSVTFTRDGSSGGKIIQTITVTYEDGTSKLAADLSYSSDAATVTIGADDNIFPLLSNPNNLSPITYDSSEPTVATVDSNGDVTLVAGGTTVITASFAGNDEYDEGSASYTLTVVNPNAPGGANNPYSVAEARAAIDANSGITGVYAKGIVSEIVTPFNSQYGNISYNISDDGTTTADQLQAYRGKSYNGENFTSENDIMVGDTVVVYGNLTKYQSTYEFAQNNQLVSLSRPSSTVTVDAPTFDPAGGEVAYGTTVTITQDDAAMIVYTTDGSEPAYSATGTNGEIYSTPIAITADMTIKAIAVDDAENVSPVATATFTVARPAAPIFTPAAGRVDAGTQVTISMDDNAAFIVYTTDGTDPSYAEGNGDVYDGPITVNETMTIKAIAVDDNELESDIAEATYTVSTIPPGTSIYRKVTATADLTDGEYLIVYEGESVALDGSLDQLDVTGNTVSVTIDNKEILGDATIDAATFTINVTEGSIKSAGGYYIGHTGSSNALKQSTTSDYTNVISIDGDEDAEITCNNKFLAFNSTSGQKRFRYMGNTTGTNKPVQLYKKVSDTPAEDVTVTVSALGYATMYYSDRNLVVPEGVKASTYKVVNGTLEESYYYSTGEVIPAGTGVVLELDSKGTAQELTFTVTESNGDVDEDNMLYGSDDTMSDSETGYKYYILSTPKDEPNGEVGFYWQQGTQGESVTNNPHKAYLKVPTTTAGDAKGFAFNDNTTGITTINDSRTTLNDNAWYTLDGRKLNGAPTQKGVYVNNGRKVIVK